jgi:coenzyme F420-reducing hydrogenase delta subunit
MAESYARSCTTEESVPAGRGTIHWAWTTVVVGARIRAGSRARSCMIVEAVLAGTDTVLLVGMGAWDLMGVAYLVKEGIKMLILATPVGLDRDYFAIKHTLNEGLEFKKILVNLILMTKQVYQCKLTIIINEGNIISHAAKRFNSMTYKLQRSGWSTRRQLIQ